MILTFVIVLAAVFGSGLCRPRTAPIMQPRGATSHIIGGEEAAPGQFPSQLTIEFLGSLGWSHSCGAILIRDRYALTAAHCVDGLTVSNLRIWGGVIYRDNTQVTGGQLLPIASICMHYNYSGNTAGFPNNLAILTLTAAADVSGPNLKNAVLPPDDTNSFTHGGCNVTGYGRTSTNFTMSNSLQWRPIIVITNQDCFDRFAGISQVAIFSEHLCMMSDPPQYGPCNGDAGSPLHCHPTEQDTSQTFVVAAMSWNAAVGGNCNLQYPAVATRLSKYLQWIYSNTPSMGLPNQCKP